MPLGQERFASQGEEVIGGEWAVASRSVGQAWGKRKQRKRDGGYLLETVGETRTF